MSCVLIGAQGCIAAAPSAAPRVEKVRVSIEAVRRAGALACAPRELALAQANYDFARMSLSQGDTARALQHLDEADENVGAAQVLTPEKSCNLRARDGESDATNEVEAAVERDSDGDSVPDAIDACPNEREDGRPPLEADGCRVADADGDGASATRAACPESPHRDETHADGCLRRTSESKESYPNIMIGEKELKLSETIAFVSETAVLQMASFALLDTLVQLLRDYPSMTLDIGGHTDSRGEDERNLALSREQAESVRRYLIEHGVEATRLTAHGYGETRPIESNSTSRGRAINRRIELLRTDPVQ